MELDLRNKNKLLIVGVALITLGCSVGKNYKRPEVYFPKQYAYTNGPDSSSIKGQQCWKEFFKDEQLIKLIDNALQHNFDLQLALKRVEASLSFSKQARAAWLPTIEAQAIASTSNPSQNSLNGISLENFLGISHLEDYTLATNLSWELDVWGKIRRQKEAAISDYLQTYEASRAVQTRIVAQVADGYYNLLMMDAQLSVAKRNAALADSIVQMMMLQKTAGEVTELAVQQALVQQQTASLLVPQLEQAISLQENGLQLLTGNFPASVTRERDFAMSLMDSVVSLGVPADLLRFRPDVRASELALKAANARVGVAQANLYPSLNISATGGLNAFEASNWFTVPASLFGFAAGSLTQPVFQRRVLKTRIEAAKIERDERVIEFRQSVASAVHDVTNALVKLNKLNAQQQVAIARANTLQLAVKNAQLLFKSGLANYLEVITAQSNALQAELEKASITRQHLTARIELYQSLGGGWN